MPEKFGFGLPRVHVGKDARTFHNNGYLAPVTDGVLNPAGQNTPDHIAPDARLSAEEMWIKGKAERYALDAVLIDRVISRALSNRDFAPPFGLIRVSSEHKIEAIENIPQIYSISELQSNFLTTLGVAHVQEMKDLSIRSKQGDNSPEVSVYNRAAYWEDIYKTHLKKDAMGFIEFTSKKGKLPAPFITHKTGITTALSAMGKVLDVLPRVVELHAKTEDINPDLFTEIARNSYHIPAELASLGLGEFIAAEEVLAGNSRGNCKINQDENRPFESYFFRITGKEGSRALQIARKAYKGLVTEEVEGQNPVYEYDSGCPASVRVDGDPATKKLWNWMVDVWGVAVNQNWTRQFEPEKVQIARHKKFVAQMRSFAPPGSRFYGIDM